MIAPHRRPFVEFMADAMEERLAANDHKDGRWDGLEELLDKLLEEVSELSREAVRGTGDCAVLLREAADVANLAGMIARYLDHEGSIPDYNERAEPKDPAARVELLEHAATAATALVLKISSGPGAEIEDELCRLEDLLSKLGEFKDEDFDS